MCDLTDRDHPLAAKDLVEPGACEALPRGFRHVSRHAHPDGMIVTQVNKAEFGNRVAPRIDFSLLNRKIADKAVPAITQGRLEETDLKCFAQIENAEALCGVTSARITEAARRPAAQWDRQLTRRGSGNYSNANVWYLPEGQDLSLPAPFYRRVHIDRRERSQSESAACWPERHPKRAALSCRNQPAHKKARQFRRASFNRSAKALLNNDAVAVDLLFDEAAATNDDLRTANPDTSAPAGVAMVPTAVVPASVTLPRALMVPCVMVPLVPAALPALSGFGSCGQGRGCDQCSNRAHNYLSHIALRVR
jgi:hypothetical protein